MHFIYSGPAEYLTKIDALYLQWPSCTLKHKTVLVLHGVQLPSWSMYFFFIYFFFFYYICIHNTAIWIMPCMGTELEVNFQILFHFYGMTKKKKKKNPFRSARLAQRYCEDEMYNIDFFCTRHVLFDNKERIQKHNCRWSPGGRSIPDLS
jgi:hypothetical protein